MKSATLPGSAGLGLVLVLLIGILGWVSLDDDTGSPAVTGTKTTSAPSRTPSPAASRNPSPSATPTASSKPGPQLLSVIYGCGSPDKPAETFMTMEDAWSAGPFEHCEAVTLDAVTGLADKSKPSEFQLNALATAYGTETDRGRTSLNRLYGICAQTAGDPIDSVVGAAATAELEGALLLCPKHPKAVTIQANIAAGKELRAAQEEIDKATAEGRLVGEGSYLVGPDVQPGTWQSVGEKVENCYWEVSDAQGNIMSNNYINIAPQFTIEIPANASGFTVRGCSFKLM